MNENKVTIKNNKIMKQISRYLLTLVALLAMTTGAWADGTVYSSSVDIHNLQVDDILVEGAEITGIESPYGFKVMPYFLRGQYDGSTTFYSSSQAIANSYAQVKIIEGGVLEFIRTDSGSRVTYTPCDADSNPFNAWIVTKIEDLGSGSYRVQITGYQYGSAEVDINPGEKTNLLDKFTQAKNSGLTVNVGTGDNAYTLDFDKEAIGSILESNPAEVNLETTYEESKQQIGTTDVLAKLIVNLTNGSNALNFNAGKVIANLKLLGNIPTGRELQTWYFDNASNLPTELIPTVYDAINKMATITMSHFSTYGLMLYTPAGIADISEDGTSAEFEMPAYDATVSYELVRDMAVEMPVTVGDGENGYRIRIKEEGESFVPAEMTIQEMMALYKVHDGIENQDLLFYGDGKVCDISIYAVDDQGQPTGQPIDFTALTPGRYVAVATAPDDSPFYAGTTPQSNIFVLYEGYEVTLDETTDNTDVLAEADGKWFDVTLTRTLQTGGWNTFAAPFSTDILIGWTVKELVSSTLADGTLTLNFSDATSIEAGKPYLVKVDAIAENPKFMDVKVSKDIVPTETTAVDFVPTLGKTEVTGDTKEILFLATGNTLLYPETLPADMKGFRAYFKLKGEAAGVKSFQLNLGDGESTGIVSIDNGQLIMDNDVYDLSGRLVNGATKKGLYIVNGKKVIIK